MEKKEVFRQNNPNSANYDDNIPVGFGYWETVEVDQEPDEEIEDEPEMEDEE